VPVESGQCGFFLIGETYIIPVRVENNIEETQTMEPFLDNQVKEQVKEIFKELVHPVKVLLFTSKVQQCEHGADTLQILTEVADLSEKIEVNEIDFEHNADQVKKYQIQRVPTYVILQGSGTKWVDFGVQFSGAPTGVEFSTLIHGVLLVSQGDSGLKEVTRQFLQGLKKPLNLRVFTTPT
jgi:alkyl hydroperoxide reductase subunit AhpF